jgi:hypothetical protein
MGLQFLGFGSKCVAFPDCSDKVVVDLVKNNFYFHGFDCFVSGKGCAATDYPMFSKSLRRCWHSHHVLGLLQGN